MPEYIFNPMDEVFAQANLSKKRADILLEGYAELTRLLETPGNIDKQTLMQSIGKTLKKAAE